MSENILKKHRNFSYHWKVEPDIIPNSFGEILFETDSKINKLKNVWAHQRFSTQ